MDNDLTQSEMESNSENLFIREKYRGKLEAYFADPAVRIVNIYGESGMGKTMLARQFAA